MLKRMRRLFGKAATGNTPDVIAPAAPVQVDIQAQVGQLRNGKKRVR